MVRESEKVGLYHRILLLRLFLLLLLFLVLSVLEEGSGVGGSGCDEVSTCWVGVVPLLRTLGEAGEELRSVVL